MIPALLQNPAGLAKRAESTQAALSAAAAAGHVASLEHFPIWLNHDPRVMPALVAGIHVFLAAARE